MKKYLFIILLVGVCIGQRDYKDLKIPNNNDDPYYNTWGRLINQQGKLVEHMEDITAMLKPFRISGNYDESDLANSVHNSISIINFKISSICAILSIWYLKRLVMPQ